ncbi:MAG: hypothetical protein IKD69_07580 [Solobacterium sp.]|nr:hypothetical protein [Solobacterium sp.]
MKKALIVLSCCLMWGCSQASSVSVSLAPTPEAEAVSSVVEQTETPLPEVSEEPRPTKEPLVILDVDPLQVQVEDHVFGLGDTRDDVIAIMGEPLIYDRTENGYDDQFEGTEVISENGIVKEIWLLTDRCRIHGDIQIGADMEEVKKAFPDAGEIPGGFMHTEDGKAVEFYTNDGRLIGGIHLYTVSD